MLTKEQIDGNKNRVLNLLSSISIASTDINIDGLTNFLNKSDFFTSPASTKYNGDYEGGLCEHCLKVYDVLVKLNKDYSSKKYSDDVLIIIGLFHCLYKVNFYEKTISNKKVYSDTGRLYDSIGHYDWVSYESYKVKDIKYRFICSDNATNSYLLLSQYVFLNEEEASAVINQNVGMDGAKANIEVPQILSTYPLVNLLHCAIMMATYVLDDKHE